MLTLDLIATLLEPLSADEPSGPDLEYDPAFMQLSVDAEGKAEQQFGDTIIPAVEPDWARVAQQAAALLERSKDLRSAIFLLRAVTHTQGLDGTALALQLIGRLLDEHWDSVHPQLDADDNNDPTMRLNALAALGDEAALVRDLYDAVLGTAPGIGPIRVRDLAVAHGALAAASDGEQLSPAAVQGGLDEILPQAPDTARAMRELGSMLRAIADTVAARSDGALDLEHPLAVARLLNAAAPPDHTDGNGGSAGSSATAADPGDAPVGSVDAAAPVSAPGEIRNRQDALKMLDRVIHFLQQSEPGNPAPLLIARAKQLIGVNFLDIINNLAPDALESIQRIAGTPSSDSSES